MLSAFFDAVSDLIFKSGLIPKLISMMFGSDVFAEIWSLGAVRSYAPDKNIGRQAFFFFEFLILAMTAIICLIFAFAANATACYYIFFISLGVIAAQILIGVVLFALRRADRK